MKKLIKLANLLSKYPEERSILLKLAQEGEVDEEKLRAWLSTSKIKEPLYHGTNASFSMDQIKYSKEGALGFGVYLTPDISYASGYGGTLLKVYAKIENPLVVEVGTNGLPDPCVTALKLLGIEANKAEKIVEKAYDIHGYVGKQIMTRAMAQGYDGIFLIRGGSLSEVVAWNKYHLALESEFYKRDFV